MTPMFWQSDLIQLEKKRKQGEKRKALHAGTCTEPLNCNINIIKWFGDLRVKILSNHRMLNLIPATYY